MEGFQAVSHRASSILGLGADCPWRPGSAEGTPGTARQFPRAHFPPFPAHIPQQQRPFPPAQWTCVWLPFSSQL